ncbi:MAG: hypothetical protein AMXMBFR61_21750 [Fimbriimonadales bacterium]
MSDVPTSGRQDIHFHASSPILRVESLDRSLDYYTRVLGFSIDWNYEGRIASVSRKHANLMLCEGSQGCSGTWVWIGVGDAAALYEEYREKGARIALAPTNYPWAYEMHVQDPDGHVIRLGSEPRSDTPFSDWVAWYREDDEQNAHGV